MKISRKLLTIDSSRYSREYDIDRSEGVHVSTIIDKLKHVQGHGKLYGDGEFSEQDLERLRALGFVFERAMIDLDDDIVLATPEMLSRLDPAHQEALWEAAMSQHARDLAADGGLSFPGEMMYCVKCDDTYPGGNVAREHIKSTGHKGIFFTVDTVLRPPKYRYGVRDWKYTNRSAARTGDDHMNGLWEWPVQLMWYAEKIGANYGEIDAMFARGDYSTRKPVMLPFRFELEMSDSDMHRNSTMLISTARSEGWV